MAKVIVRIISDRTTYVVYSAQERHDALVAAGIRIFVLLDLPDITGNIVPILNSRHEFESHGSFQPCLKNTTGIFTIQESFVGYSKYLKVPLNLFKKTHYIKKII
ncbi:hypothetical protein CDIK_0837 [Cucumispora dikerogammari]|nr:hypothetical protein CDIK_0837 [Cucumispora dikerogammari]